MAREGFLLGDLDLNDGVTYSMTALRLGPAPKKPQFAENPDGNGAPLVRTPPTDNMPGTARIEILPQDTMAEAIDAINAIDHKFASAEELIGGLECTWTPADSGRSATVYVLQGQITDRPIVVEGDDAGYFLSAPVIMLEFVCDPSFYEDEVAHTAVTSTDPLILVELADVGGVLPARARMVVTDIEGTRREDLEFGLEQRLYDDADPQPLFIDSADLDISGFTGALATRTGAYNGATNNVVAATALVPTWQTVAGLSVENAGAFRVKLGVWAESDDVRFRLRYRAGDAPFSTAAGVVSVAAPVAGELCEVDVGTIDLPEGLGGELRFEIKSATPGEDGEIDYVVLMPTQVYGRARAPKSQEDSVTAITAYDSGTTHADATALHTLAAPVGGNWDKAGDAVGLTTESDDATFRRSELSDASLYTGSYTYLDGADQDAVSVQADVSLPSFSGQTLQKTIAGGVLARFVDTNNWLMAVIYLQELTYVGSFKHSWLYLYKRVAGTLSALGNYGLNPYAHISGFHTVKVGVDENGDVSVYSAAQGSDLGSAKISVTGDSDLATGGALEDGKIGIYDATDLASGTHVRKYTNFLASAVAAGEIHTNAVIHPGQACEITSFEAVRDSSDGTKVGRIPVYRGSRFWVPPAGDSDRVSRLAVKVRQGDLTLEKAQGLTDETQVQVFTRAAWRTAPGG